TGQASAPIRHLSVWQRPVFLINSRLGLFTAAHLREHPFSRSYGVILPSSLTRVRSLTLEFYPQLPVSVYGTGGVRRRQRLFSALWNQWLRLLFSAPRHSSWCYRADLPALTTHCLDVLFQSHAPSILLRHHITQTDGTGTGISACCPSPTHLCLGLGPD